MAVGFLGTLWASASPRSRIVFNDFWVLSRRERCLDNTQKSLRAAWIGVMQKDWITKGLSMPRVVACPLGGGDAAGWVPTLVRPAGAVLFGGLSSWPRLLVRRRLLRWSLKPGSGFSDFADGPAALLGVVGGVG